MVLARIATETIVYMGCSQARRESESKPGVVWREIQLRRPAGDSVESRHLAGRNEDPIILWNSCILPRAVLVRRVFWSLPGPPELVWWCLCA